MNRFNFKKSNINTDKRRERMKNINKIKNQKKNKKWIQSNKKNNNYPYINNQLQHSEIYLFNLFWPTYTI